MKKGVQTLIIVLALAVSVLAVANLVLNKNPNVSLSPLPLSNLVAYYTFDGNVLDSSGNKLHGSLTGYDPTTDPKGNEVPAKTYVTGKYESALYFDGVDDHVRVPDSTLLDFTDRFTIAGWFYFLGKPGAKNDIGSVRLIAKEGPNNWAYRLITLDNGDFGFNDALLIQINDGTGNVIQKTSDKALANYKGKWVHIATTYDGSNLRLFINGIETPGVETNVQNAKDIINVNAYLGIGATADGKFPFNGTIDDVKIYSAAFPPNDVKDLMKKGVASVCGNSVVESGEQCDNGRQCDNGVACVTHTQCYRPDRQGDDACLPRSGDGCSKTCQKEIIAPVCGNGIKESGEQCDGLDLGGQTCTSLGYTGGSLACGPGCQLDTTQCKSESICGNNIVEPGEQCDDGNNLEYDGCSGICQIESGSKTCTSSEGFTEVKIVTKHQTKTIGGIGIKVIDSKIYPDGNRYVNISYKKDLNDVFVNLSVSGGRWELIGGNYSLISIIGATDESATIRVASDQNYFVKGIVTQIDSGTIIDQKTDDCDDANIIRNYFCSITKPISGTQYLCPNGCSNGACNPPPPVCGNGVKEGIGVKNEQCDGSDLNGQTCTTIPGEYIGGTLKCSFACTFDTNGCLTITT